MREGRGRGRPERAPPSTRREGGRNPNIKQAGYVFGFCGLEGGEKVSHVTVSGVWRGGGEVSHVTVLGFGEREGKVSHVTVSGV